MKIRHLVLSSAAVLLTATSVWAAEPAADAREEAVTSQLNAQQAEADGLPEQSPAQAYDGEEIPLGTIVKVDEPEFTVVDNAAEVDADIPEDMKIADVLLTEVTDPKATLAEAKVETTSGDPIGEVQTIVVGSDGKASSIVVEASGFLGVDEEPVQIGANEFTYVPERNVLVTDLTKTEIANLAMAE